MEEIPKKILEELVSIIKISNPKYGEDKLDTFVKLYFLCKDGKDIWNTVKMTAIWRFVSDCPKLLDKKTLGEDKYNTIMNLYNEAIQKFS